MQPVEQSALRLVTVRQAAKDLGVSEKQIYYWLRLGAPKVKIRRGVFIRLGELDEWLRSDKGYTND